MDREGLFEDQNQGDQHGAAATEHAGCHNDGGEAFETPAEDGGAGVKKGRPQHGHVAHDLQVEAPMDSTPISSATPSQPKSTPAPD